MVEADPLLVETWQKPVGFVLERRFRWAEVSAELGITTSRVCAPSSPSIRGPQSMRTQARHCYELRPVLHHRNDR